LIDVEAARGMYRLGFDEAFWLDLRLNPARRRPRRDSVSIHEAMQGGCDDEAA
jgi:hypothetical protein